VNAGLGFGSESLSFHHSIVLRLGKNTLPLEYLPEEPYISLEEDTG